MELVMRLSELEKKLLTLAFDPSASAGESVNALRVIFRNWIEKYPDGYTLVKDLEGIETQTSKVNTPDSPYASVVLGFGKHKGKCLRDVPANYLLWVLDNFEELWPETRKSIERYLEGEQRWIKQTYPCWRNVKFSSQDDWAYYIYPYRFEATCMRSWSEKYYGQWFVPHLDHAGPFSKLEDAKRLVESVWGSKGILNYKRRLTKFERAKSWRKGNKA